MHRRPKELSVPEGPWGQSTETSWILSWTSYRLRSPSSLLPSRLFGSDRVQEPLVGGPRDQNFYNVSVTLFSVLLLLSSPFSSPLCHGSSDFDIFTWSQVFLFTNIYVHYTYILFLVCYTFSRSWMHKTSDFLFTFREETEMGHFRLVTITRLHLGRS